MYILVSNTCYLGGQAERNMYNVLRALGRSENPRGPVVMWWAKFVHPDLVPMMYIRPNVHKPAMCIQSVILAT